MKIDKKYISLFCSALLSLAVFADEDKPNALPGDDLQAVLDSGKDLILKKGALYDMHKPIRIKFDNQKIYTANAKTIKDYATLKLMNPDIITMVSVMDKKNNEIKHVTFYGNRYELSARRGDGLVEVGGKNGSNQCVKECFFAYGRTGTLLKLQSLAPHTDVLDSIFFGGGTDCRGSGYAEGETPFRWGDTMTYAASEGLVKNNLMIDPSDVGVAVFCAPKTILEDNVVAGVSREPLGGINLVDIKYGCELDKDKKVFSYKGVIIRNNLIDARGARVHIAFPMGRRIWGFREPDIKLVGGTLENNLLTGKAMGYGFVAYDIEDFKVVGNKSEAIHSGRGDGEKNAQVLPPEPKAFLVKKGTVKNCELQKEFEESDLNFVHLLRCNHGPQTRPNRYRAYAYTPSEAEAVIETAYIEILGRNPTKDELKEKTEWLNSPEKYSADDLRREIMDTKEFKNKYPKVYSDTLHEFRYIKWVNTMDEIQKEYLSKVNRLPTAKELYAEVWNKFLGKSSNITK